MSVEIKELLLEHLRESKKTDIKVAKIESVQEQIVRDLIHDTTKHDNIAQGLEELMLSMAKITQCFEGEKVIEKLNNHERYFNNQAGAYRLLGLISIITSITFGFIKLL